MVIVSWLVKELFVSNVPRIIIFAPFRLEIRYPTQLTKHISLFREVGAVWHPCAFSFVVFEWVNWFLCFMCYRLRYMSRLIKVFLCKMKSKNK